MYSAFGDLNEPQSAAFGPQKHRKLVFNKQTMQWEPIAPEDEQAYDKTFAANSARGAFPILGRTSATGPDDSTQEERDLLSPQGEPDFYTGSLGALRSILAQQQQKARGY